MYIIFNNVYKNRIQDRDTYTLESSSLVGPNSKKSDLLSIKNQTSNTSEFTKTQNE